MKKAIIRKLVHKESKSQLQKSAELEMIGSVNYWTRKEERKKEKTVMVSYLQTSNRKLYAQSVTALS